MDRWILLKGNGWSASVHATKQDLLTNVNEQLEEEYEDDKDGFCEDYVAIEMKIYLEVQ